MWWSSSSSSAAASRRILGVMPISRPLLGFVCLKCVGVYIEAQSARRDGELFARDFFRESPYRDRAEFELSHRVTHKSDAFRKPVLDVETPSVEADRLGRLWRPTRGYRFAFRSLLVAAIRFQIPLLGLWTVPTSTQRQVYSIWLLSRNNTRHRHLLERLRHQSHPLSTHQTAEFSIETVFEDAGRGSRFRQGHERDLARTPLGRPFGERRRLPPTAIDIRMLIHRWCGLESL